MSFRPQLRTESLGVGPTYSFLASEHGMYKRQGITLDASVVGADADGNKFLKAGTVLGKITSNGKYGPYDNGAGDGRDTAVGFLLETVNLKDGDAVTGMLIHGSVIEARTSGIDASGKADLAGAILFQ